MSGSLLVDVVVDAADPAGLAHWWAQALEWRLGYRDEHEVDVDPPEGEPGVPLVFVPVGGPRTTRSRLHLDLDSSSPAEQRQTVEHLLHLGATPVDVGQGDVPWVVLADPEGNEFCVLEPRPEYEGTGRVAALVVSAVDAPALSRFWAAAAGWDPVPGAGPVPALRRGGAGPFLEFVGGAGPHTVKNRWHLDLRARRGGRGRDAVVRELLAAGARSVDIGQRGVTWDVLADPEGNEFCVLAGEV
ncbi:VOC family protein [Kineococcus rubinsiae]|uniref:VOC family protein n=1 Tax=Kineococcus rubinsiae TaxID=2609562 RepID=UPI00143023C4|nr:VOC family protein [Kineococcus rubinsiae]NIZ92180.1 VOC family protein [Kineococcus rubinsiae]